MLWRTPCDLIGLSRASYYYESNRDDSYNDLIMKLIDEQFTKTPFYGVPKMTESLRRLAQPLCPGLGYLHHHGRRFCLDNGETFILSNVKNPLDT